MTDLTRSTSLSIESLDDRKAELSPGAIVVPRSVLPAPARVGHRIKITVTLEEVHTRPEWAKAYAKQGLSDLGIYELLVNQSRTPANPQIASCHRLHYLQMASEKIAKAYHFDKEPQVLLKTLLTSHKGTKEFISSYLTSPEMTPRYQGKDAQLRKLLKEMKHVAGAIEELAPAVNREAVPHNVEYPWSDGTRILVPCDHRFAIEDLPPASLPKFVEILKEISQGILSR